MKKANDKRDNKQAFIKDIPSHLSNLLLYINPSQHPPYFLGGNTNRKPAP